MAIRLTDIQPAPPLPRPTEISEARYDLLLNAAIWVGLIDYADDPEQVEIDPADLPKLREAIDARGKDRIRKYIGVSGPFTDRGGYQWRDHAEYKAPVRKTLLARIDRIIQESRP